MVSYYRRATAWPPSSQFAENTGYPMCERNAVKVVRTLSRWQTFWMLCRIGRADVALELAVFVLVERLSACIAVLSRTWRNLSA